ncbi:gamma carbonic anhydrase family protein [Sporomusa sp.]|uniref:gamma carbonic anhydrase family protein n=1 Tax=Sporomusa sp. TaxID=2078658 RepID=UPI002C02220B|nr:gamma carbonic anhydrase family protein [Sporomusa sp.]HWR42428.1 gamma carbonic anhydrase family protein [Sporomusa sp.]
MSGKLIPYKNLSPHVDSSTFIAEGAKIIGNVSIGANASIWFNTVLRGDVHPITIGQYTNIQDNCTVHVWYEFPTSIGEYVTVGHGAILHGCTIANNCLIGMGAIILNYAEIGENCIIGAGTLIPEHKKIPANSLVVGSPGKIIREVSNEEIQVIRQSALIYSQDAHNYM